MASKSNKTTRQKKTSAAPSNKAKTDQQVADQANAPDNTETTTKDTQPSPASTQSAGDATPPAQGAETGEANAKQDTAQTPPAQDTEAAKTDTDAGSPEQPEEPKQPPAAQKTATSQQTKRQQPQPPASGHKPPDQTESLSPMEQLRAMIDTPPASTTHESIRDNMNYFVEAMRPGKMLSLDECAANQTMLYRTLLATMHLKGSEFHRVFAEILAYVHAYSETTFSPGYAYRGQQAITRLDPVEFDRFEKLFNLILVTANPDLRLQAMQQVDIPRTTASFNDSEIAQRVEEFFSPNAV